MAIKKGDLVKVIQLIGNDKFHGVELNKAYKVLYVEESSVYINAGASGRFMYYDQLKKVKKKSKTDKIGKVIAIINIVGLLPLVIGGALSALGIVDIGTGLGLGLFMVACVTLSLVVLFVSAVVVAIKRMLKS